MQFSFTALFSIIHANVNYPTQLHRWKFLLVLSAAIFATVFSWVVHAAYDTDGLVGYWKLDETSGSTAIDVSGHNNHLSYNGSPTVSIDVATTSFSNARSLLFNGSDYLRQATFSSQPTSNLTICSWMNTNDVNANQYIASINRNALIIDNEFVFQLSGSKLLFWDFNSPDYGFIEDEESSVSITADTWHHVCFTKNGTAGIYYIDGVSAGTKTANSNISYGSSDFFVGYNVRDGDKVFDGELDDLRLYNRTLSATEIAELAAGNHTSARWDGSSNNDFETAANWNINAIPDPYTHLIIPEQVGGVDLSKPTSGASLTIEASSFTGSYVDLHGFDFEFVDSGTLKGGGILKLFGSETVNLSTVGTTSTGTVLYYGTGSYTGLAAGDSYYNLNINDGLAGYWDFDVNEGGLTPDVSGHDNDGARANTPNNPSFSTTVPPTAFFNRNALDFDGNDYVSIKPDVFDSLYRGGDGGFTISLWQKTSASSNSGDSDKMLIGIEGGYNNGWSIYYDATDAHPSVNFTSSYSNRLEATGYTTYDGNWHHIAASYGNGTTRIFVDGVAAGSTTQTLYDITGESTETRIGYAVDNASYFSGLIDDVRVYKRVLEDHEISALAAGHVPATASGTFTLDANLDVNNNLALESGELDVSGTWKQINIGGSWLNYGGTFNHRDAQTTVLDASSGTKEIRSGGQAFFNLNPSGGATWELRDLLDLEGTLSQSSGTIDVTTDNYSIHTKQISQNGTITPRSGMVVLNGSSNTFPTITSTLNELQIEDPTEDGLVGYWKFDECQTDSTADLSGNGNNGTLVGPPLWTGSSLSSDIQFDNPCALHMSGSYVDVGSSVMNFTGTSPFSVAFWMNSPVTLGTNTIIGTDVDDGWYFRANSGGAALYKIDDGTNDSFAASQNTFFDGQWHHVTMVLNPTNDTWNLYHDGVLDTSLSIDSTGNMDDNFFIGHVDRVTIPGDANDTTMDDVRIYNRALTPIEVRRLANGQYADGQLNTATVTLSGDIDLNTMTILSGKVSAGSRTIDVSGDWNNYAGSGAFIEGTSTVDLDGSSTQNVRGSTEFYNLEASTNSTQSILFGSGTTQFITNSLTFTGAAGNLLTLGPLTAGIDWFIDLSSGASQTLNYLSVSYSDASGGDELDACADSTDGGNNENWDFACAAVAVSASGNGGWNAHRQNLEKSGGISTGDQVAQNDTESPKLTDVGIADEVTEVVANAVGGILDASMRTAYVPEELSRKVKSIAQALAARFSEGITEYRLARQQSDDTLKTSAPQLDDQIRKLQRAERNIADRSIVQLTASAIGERRGLLVAQVKSEEVVFSDVPVDSWFAPFISAVIEEQIATGYEDEEGNQKGEFGVINPVTRAEILKMALQASGHQLDAGSPRNTSAQGTWVSSYVAKAEQLSMNVFTPETDVHAPATRAEVIHTILEAAGLPVAAKATHPFTDVPAGHPYEQSIATAYLYGIVEGDDGVSTVRPDDTMNRAEVAKMIAILKQLLE